MTSIDADSIAAAEATAAAYADSNTLFNLTWTNLTQYAPSAMDLILAGPRIVKRGWSFAFITVPEAVDHAINLGRGQRMIPEATGALPGMDMNMATTMGPTADQIAQAGADILEVVEGQTASTGTRFTLDSIRGLGNVFHYATSKWALGCILMAVILNRTQVYASTRRNLTLSWKLRLALRIIPITLFFLQGVALVRSIQCQTSPDFAELRWGNSSRTSELLFHESSGGFLHTISSGLLLGSSDADSCRAVGMVPTEITEDIEKAPELRGSLSRLFPLFMTFCGSQFVEALSSAVQGRPMAAEVGMTLFEHSLAFAEADAAISTQVWGPFADLKNHPRKNQTSPGYAAQFAVKLKSKINTPPEVLLVGALSAGNHLTSHILGVFDMQKRFRLYNTGFWGLCFMSAIVWSFASFSIEEAGNHSLLRFPTVSIVGFIPHIMVVVGIVLCGAIYCLALLLSALAPPSQQEAEKSFRERLLSAHENLQTNIAVPDFARPSHELDAYSALIKIGFSALTVASEAVYLNESKEVNVKGMTWLEEDRWAEIEENGARWLGPNFRTLDDPLDGASMGLVPATERPMDLLMNSSSGYVRERIPHKVGNGKAPEKGIRDGVGAAERSGRWIMAMDFFLGIMRLVAGWAASLILSLASALGWQTRPSWLVRWIRRPNQGQKTGENNRQRRNSEMLEFWMVNDQGEIVLPPDENVDVENEMRKRQRLQTEADKRRWGEEEEKDLGSNLYEWWKNNGWWGEIDTSGQFEPTPTELDDDTTSMISMSTNAAGDEWESDNDESGRRTPTQSNYAYSRESTPATTVDNPLSMDHLSRLLNPQSLEERAEATALSSHLSSNNIVTRSRFREMQQRQRAQVLTNNRNLPKNFRSTSGRLNPEEEEKILEHLLVSRRNFHNATNTANSGSWAEGGSGAGAEGPQCVVCQSSPRTIIVWPCRCLSLCDDCRVQLAMNNFEKCVCCRREVGAFSRIYVP